MKKVITYGTFDLFHYGHLELLRRAKELGDYLIVAVSTDEFNLNEKKKVCIHPYEQRAAIIKAINYVDHVIPETCWKQKEKDVMKHNIDIFVIGDDWKGKFDKLLENKCKVVYLPRTKGVSTLEIKRHIATKIK